MESSREDHEGATLTGYRIQITTHVLDPRNAGEQHGLVCWLPVGKVIMWVMSHRLSILVDKMRKDRTRTVSDHASSERVIQRLHVDTHQFHLLRYQPIGSFLVETRRIVVVHVIVTEIVVVSSVDHHDVTWFDLRSGLLQVFGCNDPPLLLWNRDGATRAKELP